MRSLASKAVSRRFSSASNSAQRGGESTVHDTCAAPYGASWSIINAYKVGTSGSGKATANTTARTLYVLPALSRLSERRNSAQRNQQRPVAPSNTSASGEHPGEDVTSKFSITSARNGALVC